MKKDNIINDGLPKEFWEMFSLDFYDAEDQKKHNTFCSVTDLLKPVKQIILKKRYSKNIEKKASDQIWMVFGSAVHLMMEKALENNPRYLIEERMYKTINVNGIDYVISGKFDIYDIQERKIKDLKTTSIYKVMDMMKGDADDYKLQLNIYAYMAKDKRPVRGLSILYFAKDFNKRNAQYKSDYPNSMVGEEEIEMFGDQFVENFIKEKIKLIVKYLDAPDNEIPECPSHERYQDPPKLAYFSEASITKSGTINKRKSATKLFNSLPELFEFLESKKPEKYGLQFRPKGLPKKCFEYCDWNLYCHYYKKQILLDASEKPPIDFVIKESIDLDMEKEEFVNMLENISKEDKRLLKI